MRVFIIFGFVTALSIVSCREYHPRHREYVPLRRYKDTKNKRGVGDYPYGLSFGGQSFSAFQAPPPPSPAGVSFAGGYGGFGGFGGGSPQGLSPNQFGFPSASPSFSSLESSGLGNLGSYSSLSQSLSLGQGSGYSLSGGNSVNSASLLGSRGSTVAMHSSPSIGLFTPPDTKTGPVTFGIQGATVGQAQQYTPVYATGTQLGSNSYSSPTIFSSVQGPSIRAYSQPTNSVSISSLLGANRVAFTSPSLSQTAGSAQTYSVPLSAIASSSSPSYSVAIPHSYSTASENFASSSPHSTYQLAISPSIYSKSPLSSTTNHFSKYIPISSDGSMYLNKDPVNSYNTAVKLSSYANPSSMYESPSKLTLQQADSTGTNYDSPSQTVTSYGTPVMMFSSTNYGTPSQQTSSSSTQYTTSSSENTNPSIGYAASSSYSSPSSISSSSTHQTDSLQKGPINNFKSSTASYISSNSNYGSSSSSPTESNFISGYKIQLPSSTSTLSNSIENYSSVGQPSLHDSRTDTSSSYSNHAPRYIRYPSSKPSPYLNNEEESMGSSYDTISYSVPSEKY